MSYRPDIEIDWAVLDAMIQYGATCLDCAGRFQCSDDTIVRHIKAKHDMNFAEYSNKMMYSVRMRLRDKMFQMAMAGNTAIVIFLSKNWLGMSDNSNLNINTKTPITIVYNRDDGKTENKSQG